MLAMCLSEAWKGEKQVHIQPGDMYLFDVSGGKSSIFFLNAAGEKLSKKEAQKYKRTQEGGTFMILESVRVCYMLSSSK